MPLPSGLSEQVEESEDIARFLTSSSHYNTTVVKPAAFLPNPKNGETSVFRHGAEPLKELKAIAQVHVGIDRKIHGAAIVKARTIRKQQLEVEAKEPPPRHADIINWPSVVGDPKMSKAEQKKKAAIIAQEATHRLIFSV